MKILCGSALIDGLYGRRHIRAGLPRTPPTEPWVAWGPCDKPAILAVDDDPGVLASISRDVRSRYGQNYRVVRAESGPKALHALAELALRARPVALIATDQRMPEMTGRRAGVRRVLSCSGVSGFSWRRPGLGLLLARVQRCMRRVGHGDPVRPSWRSTGSTAGRERSSTPSSEGRISA